MVTYIAVLERQASLVVDPILGVEDDHLKLLQRYHNLENDEGIQNNSL